jgi:hypothetical protein
VADDRRLAVQPADDGLEVVGDLPDRLAGEHLGMLGRLLDRLGVVRPAGGQGHIAVVLEQLGPAVPAVGQQPQAMHEHHRRAAGLVARWHCSSSYSVIVLPSGGALDVPIIAARDDPAVFDAGQPAVEPMVRFVPFMGTHGDGWDDQCHRHYGHEERSRSWPEPS